MGRFKKIERVATKKSVHNPYKDKFNNIIWFRWVRYILMLKGFSKEFRKLDINHTIETFVESFVSVNEIELKKAAKVVSDCF